MERSEFLQMLTSIIAAPVAFKDFAPDAATELLPTPINPKFAIDVHALTAVGVQGPGGKMMTPKEIIELFQKTGILLYRHPYPEDRSYQPITVLEE